MNYFLLLIILGMGGAGYYEYQQLQQQDAANQTQFADLAKKVDALTAENKQLEEYVKAIKSPDAAPAGATATTTASAPAATAKPKGPSNILGTIVDTNGKTYQGCRLLKVEADGVVLNYADGITKVSYGVLPPELQQRFGYNSTAGSGLTPEQVAAGEQQRQAAGD